MNDQPEEHEEDPEDAIAIAASAPETAATSIAAAPKATSTAGLQERPGD